MFGPFGGGFRFVVETERAPLEERGQGEHVLEIEGWGSLVRGVALEAAEHEGPAG